MTIAVSVKVSDGVALATDSAASMTVNDANGNPQIITVYNNANKIINLRKGLPLGIMTCGVASVGDVSLNTLLKHLRKRFTDGDKNGDGKIDPLAYTVQDVAERVTRFVIDEHIEPWIQGGNKWAGVMLLIVAGFSHDKDFAEVHQIVVDEHGNCQGPTVLSASGVPVDLNWAGQPEAIYRLAFGVDQSMPEVLKDELGIPEPDAIAIFEKMKLKLSRGLIMPAMPIQDAIDLADFLADMTAKFSRFQGGHATVGGPIEVAAITKHEGFKWVRRKYYYDRQFNPEEERR